MNSFTVSCLYSFLVSDTFNRQVIKEGAISANVPVYDCSSIQIAAGKSAQFAVNNFFFLRSDTPLNLTGDIEAPNTQFLIVEATGNVLLTNPSSNTANISIINS